MKVLIATGVFPPESGGPATYSKTLLEWLPRQGIETEVLAFREVRKYPKVVRHIVYFFLVLRRARQVDIVYAQDPVSVGLPAMLASWLLKKKFALKVVGDYAWEQAAGRGRYKDTIEHFQNDDAVGFFFRVLRAVERFVASRAEVVVVPSRYLGKIVASWGVREEKIRVIYNGIDPHEVGLKQVIRGLLRFRGELVVSSGRLVRWKGCDTLIRIHAKMKKNRPSLKLLIVGGGPELHPLEALADSLGVSDSIIFTGAVENAVALRYMRAADVFVLNTKYEGFSHTLLEAAAVGVPIITTAIGGNPEFIDDGMSGYMVTPDDERAIQKKITALLDAPEKRARLSANAKRKVEKFSIEKMVRETALLLAEVGRR